jgi:alpha-D-xyloside xylohydrolase
VRAKILSPVLLSFLLLAAAQIPPDTAAAAPAVWREIAPGIWKAVIGTPEQIDLLKAAGSTPRLEALKELGSASRPYDLGSIQTERLDGRTILRFPLAREEGIFGLGLNFQSVNQRGKVLELRVDHYGGADNGRSHAPVPFFISDKGYGIFLNAARFIRISTGVGVRRDAASPPPVIDRNTGKNWQAVPPSEFIEAAVPGTGLEVYVFAGPTMLKAVQRFNLFCGGGVLPPKWGLGFIQRTPTLYSDRDVAAEVAEFDKRDFPLDVIGLEPGWQSMAYPCTFEWDKTRFPDPDGFLRALKAMGIRINLWLNPYVSPAASIYSALKPLSGSHLVWNGIVADFTLNKARAVFENLIRREHIGRGVSGYKIDEVDGFDVWLWPDHARFPSGLSGEQMRQIYGALMQKMTSRLFRADNLRTYGLTRGSNAGCVSYPYVIYNDSYNHREFITALITSSYIGVQWTPEVRSSKTAEEWVRRMQTACFSPMAMLNAWSDGTKPWSFPEVEALVRDAANLRMRFLPFLYSIYADYAFRGLPPFRAMNLMEGAASTSGTRISNPRLRDQYLVGENLLVAPVFAGETSRRVELPSGRWFDFYTGKLAGEGGTISVESTLGRIPLFVRDGGLIPLIERRRRSPRSGETVALEVRVYGAAAGEFVLYDDDGETYDYEKGAYSLTRLRTGSDAAGNRRGEAETLKRGPMSYSPITWTFMPEAGK